MTDKEEKAFIIIAFVVGTIIRLFLIVFVIVLSIILPWTLPLWIILGILSGGVHSVGILLECLKEKTKTIPPATNEVPNEDFENALRDWNKNRRRGTQRKD